MPSIALDTLISRVTGYFRRHAERYGLNPATTAARYILNPGGFVNASFFIMDGTRRYHLKLARDAESAEQLARWAALHQTLTEHYHAPRMLDWIKLPRLDFEGPLFDYIPGRPADLANQPAVLAGVLDLLARLHADRALAQAITDFNAALAEGEAEDEPADPPVYTCADYFLDVFISRFDEDLIGIVNDLPPFVPLKLVDWMMGETRELEGLARDLPAFQRPADSPTHGDLWPSNILVTPAGDWFVIDWDDLALGDPALEYGIVLDPLWRGGQITLAEAEDRAAAAAGRLLPDPAAQADFRARFRVCLRAQVLNFVIDPLADWVEAAFAPQHIEAVRADKERQHREALALYQSLYPG